MKHLIRLAAAVLTLSAGAALSDPARVVDDHILPGYATLAQRTADLRDATAQSCTGDAPRAAWHAAFDAWMGVSHLRFGPVEAEGRAVVIAFWPDTRGMTPKALSRLIADQDPIVADPEAFRDVSVAARGLYALEFLLFDAQFDPGAPYTCALIRAASGDLADIAADVLDDWQDRYGDTLRRAGAAGNTTYLSPDEAAQALFTSLLTGLEFTADQRLGRPLGTFDRPRAALAETRRAGRSLRNVALSIDALHDLADTLSDAPMPVTDAAFDRAAEAAADLEDPVLAGVDDPAARLKIEILQQAIEAAELAVSSEIGPALGVSQGFNATDGD